MITYDPLIKTLSARNMELKDLENGNGGVLNKRTVSKLRHNHTMNLMSLVEVCQFLRVPIEEVIRVKLD